MGSLDRVFDVVVIGGGLNGVAIARDCAMRRLSVALFDKEDLGAGSSGAPPGLLVESGRPGDAFRPPSRAGNGLVRSTDRWIPGSVARALRSGSPHPAATAASRTQGTRLTRRPAPPLEEVRLMATSAP